MEQKSEPPPKSSKAPDPLAALAPLLPATWMSNVWFENLSDLGAELTAFVAERIKEDVKAQHALLHCKSLTELQRVQASFLQKTFEQYHAETGKLVEMSSEMAAKLNPKAKPDA